MPTSRTTCLVAPDKFKGSLDATGVAQALRAGLQDVRPELDVGCRPMADGGDGTLAVLTAAGFERIPVTVDGPTGCTVQTSYAARDTTAVVELANTCGLSRLPDNVPAPLDASSYGLGQVVAAAVRNGCRELVIGLGGSASTDGGAGLLQALGARLLDGDQREVRRGGRWLADVSSVDLDPARELLQGVSVTVAADVDNPLLGARGAAATYGPQKGADPAQVHHLEHALTRWATVVEQSTGTRLASSPSAGAAGGVGFAALALGASVRSGIELLLELTDFAPALATARLVITGEGQLDRQSLAGKAPVGVAPRHAPRVCRSSRWPVSRRSTPPNSPPPASPVSTCSPASNRTSTDASRTPPSCSPRSDDGSLGTISPGDVGGRCCSCERRG